MRRTRAAATAGAAAVTAIAAALGLGATFGLFGLTEPDSGVVQVDRHHVATMSADATATASMPDD